MSEKQILEMLSEEYGRIATKQKELIEEGDIQQSETLFREHLYLKGKGDAYRGLWKRIIEGEGYMGTESLESNPSIPSEIGGVDVRYLKDQIRLGVVVFKKRHLRQMLNDGEFPHIIYHVGYVIGWFANSNRIILWEDSRLSNRLMEWTPKEFEEFINHVDE